MIGAAIEPQTRVGTIDRAVEKAHDPGRHVLGSIDSEPVNADLLHQPLRVAHEVAQAVLGDGRSGRGNVGGVVPDGDVCLSCAGVKHDAIGRAISVLVILAI